MSYKIGQILTANRDIEVDMVFGTKQTIKKGSRLWIGADRLGHHQDGTLQPLADNVIVDGYDTGGVAERILLQLKHSLPIEDFLEDYDLDDDDVQRSD